MSVPVLALAVIAGCGGTKTSVTQTWKAEIPAPAMRSMIVFGARMDETNRRVLEDELVAALKKDGVDARQSYLTFPELPDRATAREAVKKMGVQGVLVATLKSVRQESTYVPSTYYGAGTGLWSGYYGGPTWGYWDPGYVVTDKIVSFDTTLWTAVGEGQMVWAATTETTNPSAGKDFATSLSKTVVERLQKDGFVPKRE